MEEEEKNYWIAFSTMVFIGPLRFRLLKKYFGSAKKAWFASEKELKETGLSDKLISSFVIHRNNFKLSDYLFKINKLGVKIITSEEKAFPKLLKENEDFPYLLYVKSNNLNSIISFFSKPAITIVGSRKASIYGLEVAEFLTRQLCLNGFQIISGMAYGIDAKAHETAIDSNGNTIAVMGSGLDIIYPAANKYLFRRIIEKGATVSEFPLGFKPTPWSFPIRDRIMAGLSLGVLVIEAAKKSGSLITASYAGEYGREVFVVPGSIFSSNSEGANELLKKGAKLVTNIDDILNELNVGYKKEKWKPKLLESNSKEEKLIIDILSSGQLHINNIKLQTNLSISILGSLLTEMELKGLVKNYRDGYFGINKR